MNAQVAPWDGKTPEAEQRLLDFVAALVLELAHTHSRVTQEQVALMIARVALGGAK
jgi:hypothetical protein